MTAKKPEANWKLKLRYGKLSTEFQHYTIISEGMVENLVEGFTCPAGPAFMAMKAWASSVDEAADMARSIGNDIGFTVIGRIYVYKTDPAQSPREKPFGYDINFTPFRKKRSSRNSRRATRTRGRD
jgi:hypothetical protein